MRHSLGVKVKRAMPRHFARSQLREGKKQNKRTLKVPKRRSKLCSSYVPEDGQMLSVNHCSGMQSPPSETAKPNKPERLMRVPRACLCKRPEEVSGGISLNAWGRVYDPRRVSFSHFVQRKKERKRQGNWMLAGARQDGQPVVNGGKRGRTSPRAR